MSLLNKSISTGIASCIIFLLFTLPSAAAPGVTDSTIVFGQTACFSGPNKNLGLWYRAGILTAFQEQNDRGGVYGRLLRLISVDDAYEPDLAAANAEMFASQNNVFAVIGGVGTPTAKRIVPVLRTAQIPFVGPFTGAAFLRDAKKYPNIINLRAGYFDEIYELVHHMIDDLGKSRFGIIYQDDAFGRSVLKNYKEVLDSRDLPLLAKTSYSRNTHAVHASLFALDKADLDAIVIVGAYAANSEIINLANSLGHKYIIANLSFVLSRELKKRINTLSDKILVTEVMPDAQDLNSHVVRQFQQAIRFVPEDHEHEFNEVCLEGYILGRYLIAVLERMGGELTGVLPTSWPQEYKTEVLERMGDELTRERFMKDGMSPAKPVVIGDWVIHFKSGENTGSSYIRLTHLGGDHSAKGE